MRIISKGRDYYDSTLVHGADTTIVYNRSSIVSADVRNDSSKKKQYPDNTDIGNLAISVPDFPIFFKYGHVNKYIGMNMSSYDAYVPKTMSRSYIVFNTVAVWVAGVRYYGCYLNVKDASQKKNPNGTRYYRIIWTVDALEKEIAALGITEYSYVRYGDGWRKVKVDINDFFTPSKEDETVLIENGVSVMTYGPLSINSAGVNDNLNASPEFLGWTVDSWNLKDYEFFRVIDPYQTMQEISMWRSGVLPSAANPMVEITGPESLMLNKHGFDKWTFKKQKEIK